MHSNGFFFRVFLLVFFVAILTTSVYYSEDSFLQGRIPTDDCISVAPKVEVAPVRVLAYTEHDSIEIGSNADFVSQGWPGSGTEADPYVIEGLNITSSDDCIFIHDTSAYFVIRNCILTGSPSTNGAGIRLENMTAGTISQCDISANLVGVDVQDSIFINIVNNTISSNWDTGIVISDSYYISLENNTIASNMEYGVTLYASSKNNLTDNTFLSTGNFGVEIASSTDNNLTGNTFVECGVFIDGWVRSDWHQFISPDNLVNGLPIGFFVNKTGGTIDGSQYGQVIIVNGTDLLVDGGTFSNVSIGIELGFSTGVTISNVVVSQGAYDISIRDSHNITMVDSTIESGKERGMELRSSSNCTLINNTFTSNEAYGLSIISSSHNTLYNNTFMLNNRVGVYLESSFNNTLANNTFTSNTWEGVYSLQAYDNYIINNTFLSNEQYGVRLYSSHDYTLTNNIFENNGVFISDEIVDNWHHTIGPDNLVNGRPVGYFWNLTGGIIDGSSYGQVILANCTDVILNGGTFNNASVGVELGFATNVTVANITSSNGVYGAFLECSSNNTLVNNTLLSNDKNGATLDQSDCNTLVNNTFSSNNVKGISLVSSDDNYLANNDILSNSQYGVHFETSSNDTMVSNTLAGNGVIVDGSTLDQWNHTLGPDNTVNSKKLGYFLKISNAAIDGSQYGQLIFAYCTDVVVDGGDFSNASIGVMIESSKNITIANANASYGIDGMDIFMSDNITLVNNTIASNSEYGVTAVWGSNNTIMGNQIVSNEVFGMGAVFLGRTTLTGNNISANGDRGVALMLSGYNNVTNNMLSANGHYGISLESTSYNTIEDNQIMSNGEYGVFLDDSSNNNSLWRNTFAWNVEYNGYDDGADNQWNSSDVGNYWSDYVGSGVYHIPGSAGSVDYHPMLYDPFPPTIDHPADISYVEGTTGHSIIWHPDDDHPSRYEVYRNGTLVISVSWDGGNITMNVEGLIAATYNFTVVVYDAAGNSVSDTVLVVVTSPATATTTTSTTTTTTTTLFPPPTELDPMLILILAGVGIGVAVIFVITMLRRRQSG